MKRLFILLFISISLYAATTQVSQSVVGSDGQPANGRVSIQISAACRSGANYVGIKPINVTISGGVFSQALVPNDSCLPAGTTYAVTWQLSGGNSWTETWLVPTSTTPVTVDSVVASVPPALSYVIQWSQMGQNGAAVGQSPIWNGTVWLPGTVTGGSGISGAPPTWPSFATVATSGSYADLSNKPTIPAAQVSSDWSAVSGVAQILNKPTIPTVPVSSVFGRTGAVVAANGDYTTALVTEATNLYFTNARAVSAMAGLYQAPIAGAPGTWPTFATVATSGSYTDLTSKPTILVNPMTTIGDMIVGGTSGALARLAAPGNGTWCPSWSSGVVTLITCPGAGGGLSSVGLTMPSGFTVGSSPLTANGTLAVTFASTTASFLPIAPTTGGVPTWRALVAADIPALTYQAPITGAPGTWPSFATVATSGSYTDLSSKPTIPAAQVNSDWSAVSGLAQILNKPALATVATSGSYADLSSKPTIAGPSITTPVMDGTAAIGTATTYAKADHVHPTDTSRQATITLGSTSQYFRGDLSLSTFATDALAAVTWSTLTGKPSFATVATSGSYGDLTGSPTVPGPSITTPIINGTAAIGTAATYAKADHVHPTDTSRQAALGFTPENAANRNIASGYAPLDAAALLPAANLPTLVTNMIDSSEDLSPAGTYIGSVNGALSTPAFRLNGTWLITGGSTTTTKPMMLIEPTGATSAAWSVGGTGFGVNAPSGFAGLISDFQLNGSSRFSVTTTGAATVSLNVTGANGISTQKLVATGIADGLAPVTVTTGASATLGGTFSSGYTINQEATAATAVIYTLPTAAAGKQYCIKNSIVSGTGAADTGVLRFSTSAAGQFIIYNGTIGATNGYFISGGAAGDAACVVGIDATHWEAYAQVGTWTVH